MQVILGILTTSYGVKGEIKVKSSTDFAKIRFKKGNKVTLFNPLTKDNKEREIASYRNLSGVDIISFNGINSPEEVSLLRGYQILIDKPENSLNSDEFYYADLINCKLVYKDMEIGIINDVFDSGAHIILRVSRIDKKDLLYPFVDKFINKVDIENKLIDIKPIEGMIDL